MRIERISDSWWNKLLSVAADREHGAQEIILSACQIFASAIKEKSNSSKIIKACDLLLEGQPAMAPVLRFATELKLLFLQGDSARVDIFIQKWNNDLPASIDRFCKFLVDEPPESEIWGFYSFSSTVMAGIGALASHGYTKEAIVSESRPGNEGIKTAEFLASKGWKVSLLPDSCFFDLVSEPRLDLLISGCDAFNETEFINKTGSGPLARLATGSGVDVEIWTSKFKFLSPDLMKSIDLFRRQGRDIAVENPLIKLEQPLFGKGKISDISRIRCEDGIVENDQIKSFFSGLNLDKSSGL